VSRRSQEAGRSAARATGFTLVELLMVILILMFLFGMVATMLGKSALGNSQVKAAAYELAAVLGKARQMAMDHRSVYGVSFNIENAPGSSGSVINNRSGGHWYRIIGPHDPSWLGAWSGVGGYNLPLLFDRGSWCPNPPPPAWPPGAGDYELGQWLAAMQNDFIGEKYYLPKGKVRFLALLDEDNGNNYNPSAAFGPTYPRPWFGDFLPSPADGTLRLFAWGGYDQMQAFNDVGQAYEPARQTGVNYSGFYYQGDDPPIIGCENPRDRFLVNNPTYSVPPSGGDPQGATSVSGESFQLFSKGQVRRLVNGDWLDCVILFNPDGTATMGDWMGMRHQYGYSGNAGPWDCPNYYTDNTPGQPNLIMQLSCGDMCNYYRSGAPYNNRYENSSYANVTGTYYFTLAKDAPDDTVAFPDAQAALTSMWPIYRVGVSKLGEITVIKVTSQMPVGKSLDAKWAGATWNTAPVGYSGYYNNLALSSTGTQLMPTENVVTTQMMTNQQWWFDP